MADQSLPKPTPPQSAPADNKPPVLPAPPMPSDGDTAGSLPAAPLTDIPSTPPPAAPTLPTPSLPPTPPASPMAAADDSSKTPPPSTLVTPSTGSNQPIFPPVPAAPPAAPLSPMPAPKPMAAPTPMTPSVPVAPMAGSSGNTPASSPSSMAPMPPSPVTSGLPAVPPPPSAPGLAAAPKPPVPPAPPAPGVVPAPKPMAAAPAPTATTTTTTTTTTNTKPAGKAPLFAKAKQSPLKWIALAIGGLLILGVVGFLLSQVFGGSKTPSTDTTTPKASTAPTKQTTITYWGLWEPQTIMGTVLKEFEKQNPGVLVKYEQQKPQDYRERLQTAIASGQGPDLFRFHASWVPMLKAELSPLPSSVMTTAQFQQAFYPVATQQLQLNSQIVGVPIMYDSLALYYNKEVLTTAGAQPPKTWGELRDLAGRLTVTSGTGIQRAGVALGTGNNVDHFSEVIGLLALQNGGDLTNPSSAETSQALTFYTNFATQDKVWNDQMPSSTVAFARGDVAMMFAPSWRYHEIKALNPDLDFGVAAVPQLSATPVVWASYWAEGVSAQSKNKDQSWALIKYLSSPEVMKQLYGETAKVRTFGELYSRPEIAAELITDARVGAFYDQATLAKSWYLNGWTFDNGLNDLMIKYYRDAVNAMVGGKSVTEVVPTLTQGTAQVLRQYGLSAGTTAPTTGAPAR